MILRTVKAVPEYGKRKSRHSVVGGKGGEANSPPQAPPDENANEVSRGTFEITFVSV